jgi:hypothetical protein
VSVFAVGIKRNLEIIDEYIYFPQRLYQYKYLKELWVKQITNQLKKIVEITGGWLVSNMQIIKDWFVFVKSLILIIKSWQILINLTNAQATCPTCKSYRFSFLALIGKFL